MNVVKGCPQRDRDGRNGGRERARCDFRRRIKALAPKGAAYYIPRRFIVLAGFMIHVITRPTVNWFSFLLWSPVAHAGDAHEKRKAIADEFPSVSH